MFSRGIPFLLFLLLLSLAVTPIQAGCFCTAQVHTYSIGGNGQTCSQISTNLQNDVPGWADSYCVDLGFSSSCMRDIQLGPCSPNPNTPGTFVIYGSFSTRCLACFTRPDPPPHGQ